MVDEIIHATRTIGEVKRIVKIGGRIFRNLQEIDDYVETPLRSACRYLWNSGIKTEDSGANMKGQTKEFGTAYVHLNWRFLSERNKSTLRQLAEAQPSNFEILEDSGLACIKTLVTKASSEEIVSSHFLAWAQLLKPQLAEWTYIPETELKQQIALASFGDSPTTREDYINALVLHGHYYDREEDKVYYSRDLHDLTLRLRREYLE